MGQWFGIDFLIPWSLKKPLSVQIPLWPGVDFPTWQKKIINDGRFVTSVAWPNTGDPRGGQVGQVRSLLPSP